MRTALIEAAWIAVQRHPLWKERFGRLSKKIGPGKAIVAMARKLLVVIWQVLTHRCVDLHAATTTLAQQFMRWGKFGGKALRGDLTSAAFVRLHLQRLGIGEEITSVSYGGRTFSLPPPSLNSA